MMKTVLVTGASRGIGEATARLFADRGWQVAAAARNPEVIASGIQGSNVAAIRLDVTDTASIQLAVDETERRFAPVDVLVNNAGTGLGGAVEGVTRAELMRLFDLNLFGLIAMTQAVLPLMRKRGSGVIVNVSSAAGRVGLPFLAPYCASKYAVEGLTEAMSYELAPFGIRTKLIEPGGVKTSFTHPWTQSAPYNPEAARVHDQYSNGMEKAAGPEGVAEAIFRAATDGQSRLRYPVNGAGAFLNLNQWLPEGAWRRLINRTFLKPA